ncbi:hypothetical protein HPB49_012266 [Dermacentor silvarum]|uniref:Uncharacterized protein n=1 Tax=Dermacentor silvarum TaxID=543639 RepID=A0ACB8DP21_DERSI|nr:hypothetical protein HPB49_012266 [Dermacentor silvarum]
MGHRWSSSRKKPVIYARDQKEFWSSRWKTGDTPWQTQGIHRFYGRAHNVIGVEYIERSASEFFTDNGLPCEETTCHELKCKVFRTLDHRLQIFVCSIFEFNRDCAGTMDIVWDRGALVAVNDDERPSSECKG